MDRGTSPYWSQFFSQLNLSPEWVEYYSQSFTENSMQLEMIPDLQPDFMSYLGIHKLGHLILIKNFADELLSRLSPLSPSILSYPSSDFGSCHSNISLINTNLPPTFSSEATLDPHEFETTLPSNPLDITTSIPIEPTPDTDPTRRLTSNVTVTNKRLKTKRLTLTSVTNELQSTHINISNTPHLTNLSDGIDPTSHPPGISSPGVFVFHTETTRPVISRSHPSSTDTQLRNENDKYTSPVKSGIVLSANKIDDSQFSPDRNQLTNIMSSSPNSLVQNPTDFIPMLQTSQDTSIAITRTNLDIIDASEIDPDELSSPPPATHLNSIQLPTNSPCVTEMSPVHDTSRSKRKPARTKRKPCKRLRIKSPPIVVRQFDPGLFEELLPPPISPQIKDLTVAHQSDINTTKTVHVHDIEIGNVTRRGASADSTSPPRPQMISVSLTELNSYEQYPISATVERDLSENTQTYLAKLATDLGELPNFFDQEKIKTCPQKKTRLRGNNIKTQAVKNSPTKSTKLHNKKTRIGVRTNKLIKPMRLKTKLTLTHLKKNEFVRPTTGLPFDTHDRSTSPEDSEPDLDRRIKHSLAIVKKKYHNFYTTIYPELQSQDNVIKLPTKRKRDYATPKSLKDTLIQARQERRNFACHKCLLCFETPYQLLQHSMLKKCDEITGSHPEY